MSAVRHYSFDKPGDQVIERVRVSYSDRKQSYAASAFFKIVDIPGGRYYGHIIATNNALISFSVVSDRRRSDFALRPHLTSPSALVP